jgi:hypothetical protein
MNLPYINYCRILLDDEACFAVTFVTKVGVRFSVRQTAMALMVTLPWEALYVFDPL